MSLLGEISKNSEALRYHAKAAEIAGQNLAHVDDESYARQRVLTREGVMHGNFGGLQTSGLESSGLDHARSVMLDKRVVRELGETASLTARKEIVDLLQGALGEKITREGINAGLNDSYNSDLAPGSLSHALNEFFNKFQELSASPDDPTIKQSLFYAVQTLTQRFNEAGSSFDEIDADLTETVRRSIDDANRILAQINEVNIQVRRFELQDRGKAVSYRDRRQALLEELAQIIDFEVEEETLGGKPTGFINLFASGTNGENVVLLDSTGERFLQNQWGQEFNVALPEDPTGQPARVTAKIDAEGKLGRLEVLNGGSKYDDSENPLIVTLFPPKSNESVDILGSTDSDVAPTQIIGDQVTFPDIENGIAVTADNEAASLNAPANGMATDRGVALSSTQAGALNHSSSNSFIARKEGEVFYQGGSYYQALSDTQKDDALSDEKKFMQISSAPNGFVEETKLKYSHLDSFLAGEQILYEDQIYQARTEVAPVLLEPGTPSEDIRTVTGESYDNGDVMFFEGNYYLVTAADGLPSGSDISTLPSDLENEFNGLQNLGPQITIGNFANVKQEVGVASGTATTVTVRSYQAGEVFRYPQESGDFQYYQAIRNIAAGADLSVDDPDLSLDFYNLGNALPKFSNLTEEPDENGYYVKNGIVRKDVDGNTEYDVLVGSLNDTTDDIQVNAFIEEAIDLQVQLSQDDQPIEYYSFDQTGKVYAYESDENPEEKTFFLVHSNPGTIPAISSDQLILWNQQDFDSFNPNDDKWSNYFHVFDPQQIDPSGDSNEFLRKSAPIGYNLENGTLQKLNLGVAEATVKNGEITGFNILNEGISFPSSDGVFVDGIELKLESGSISGYQKVRFGEMDTFRQSLNSLVSDFVLATNEIYNPNDEPGAYLFGFDANLTRATQDMNPIWAEDYLNYGLTSPIYGAEGNGEMKVYRDEVDMTLPYAESDTFRVVNSTLVFPNEYKEHLLNEQELTGIDPDSYPLQENYDLFYDISDFSLYGEGRRMKFVTTELDSEFPGDDRVLGNEDDGRSLLLAYETIPFKVTPGTKMFALGDSFSFDAVLNNSWNLASSLRMDDDLTPKSIIATFDFAEGANDVALAIAEMSNGKFSQAISDMNTAIGNSAADLNDNIAHQNSVESLLLDQRRAVSAVSIDEEVADLMQFQRSFQASSRVLNTLDKMLELVVMSLIR